MKSFFAIILIFLGSVLHAEENPLGITFFGSFLHTDRVPNALFFFSDIQKNDGFELRRALRTHEIDTIVLASPGGSVWEGLSMAGMIFDKKMTAYVPPLPEGKGCYSACAYMFFAGQTRLAVGELGVHQIGAYDAGVDSEKQKIGETQQATQFTTSEVIGFLNEFGTPPWVYERMFRSREIYVFTEDEKKDLNQGQLEPSLRGSIDTFLDQLRKEIEKAAKTEPKTSAATAFDKSNKDMVKALQVLLNEAKCSAGVADGVWGGRTNAAAERFAKANSLDFSGPSSINSTFLAALKSEGRKDCPAETKKNLPVRLPYKWNFDLVCNGKQIQGSATFSHQSTSSNGEEVYGMRYQNSLGGVYFGKATISPGKFVFTASMDQQHRVVGSGAIVLDTGRWRVRGTSSDGCSFSGYSN